MIHNPEEGRAEIKEIYYQKGFRGELLDRIVTHIISDKKLWVETMMREELAMIPAAKSPLSLGFSTFVSFILIGFVPLLVYVVDYIYPLGIHLFFWASVFTTIAFIFIGILKSYVNERSIIRGVSETLFLGIIAAILAYLVGDVLEQIF